MTPQVLIVDDDPDLVRVASRMLEPEGYVIGSALSGNEALRKLDHHPYDVVLTDVDMPMMSGLELLSHIKDRWSSRMVVMMSGLASIDMAVKAVKCGAFDFVPKPLDRDRLKFAVNTAMDVVRMREDQEPAQGTLVTDIGQELIGASPIMLALRSLIERVAPTDGRVLIEGENGTGKELIANAIHRNSSRRDRPFIKVNCGALPGSLVESELFGHERGAFTGAVNRRPGRFEMADGGTLLLDEIGEMPLDMQVKLLRVIQEGQFERVGATQTQTVDVRILAATNRDLGQMVSAGTFREDLFYRLNVVSLQAPPLRDRREDIPALIEHILSRRKPDSRVEVSQALLDELATRHFPGNVRELQNIIDRLAIFYPGQVVGPQHLGDVAGAQSPPSPERNGGSVAIYQRGVSYRDRLQQLERLLITEALVEHEQSKGAAAESLGTDKSFFYRKCRQFGIG